MENTIKGEINQDDIRRASSYWNTWYCLLAQSLRRMYPKEYVEVYPNMFYVGGEYYEFGQDVYHKIRLAYKLINIGERKEVKPFSWTAFKMK